MSIFPFCLADPSLTLCFAGASLRVRLPRITSPSTLDIILRLRRLPSPQGTLRQRKSTGPQTALQTLYRSRNSMHLRLPAKEKRSPKSVRHPPPTYKYSSFTPLLSYLRRLQEAAAATQKPQSDTRDPTAPDAISPNTTHPSLVAGVSPPPPSGSSYLESPLTPSSSIIPPSRYPIAADSFHYSPIPHISFSGSHEPTASSVSRPEDTRQFASSGPYDSLSAYNWSYKHHHPSSILPQTDIPYLSTYCRPRRLEDIAPRDTISLIIALFFDFVYPLTPSVHKPSFMADLHSHREERDPLFFALVMSTVASTLVQVPRSYLPMERSAVRKLAQSCYEASRHITVASYDPPTSMHVVIRYLYDIVCPLIVSSNFPLQRLYLPFLRGTRRDATCSLW